MPDPSLPHWWRMLSWGLLASLLLHWVAFDLMRATAWLPSAPTRAGLQVSLRAHGSDVPRDLPRDAPANTQQPQLKPHLATPDAATGMLPMEPREAIAQETAVPLPKGGRLSVDTSIEGLRSGVPAEAMTGLRLALAQRLGAASMPAGLDRVLVWCDFDAEGRVLDVRAASGTMEVSLQTSVRQALGQLALPAALLGKAFSLDVLLESGD